MKKKLTKAIAILMCVIIACMSMSVSVFAANKDVYTIDKLQGHTVNYAMTNESETCALMELDYGMEFASTFNGRDYKFFNYHEYLPDNCDEIVVYDYVTKGDTFAFLLRSYKLEEFWDYDESEGVSYKYEELVLKEQMILTTTDFNSFKEYKLDFGTEDEYYAYFECIGDKIIYGTIDHVEENGKTYFEGVYYTTTDFANWTKHTTPKEEATGLYQDIYYSVAGNTLCIELYTSDDDMYLSSKAFATQDFSDYTTVFGGFKNGETLSPFFCASPVEGKIIRIGDAYSANDFSYLRSEIALVDVKTGEEEILLNGSLNVWEYYCNDNNFCLVYEREEGDPAEVFMYNERAKKFETEKTDYSIMDVYFEGYLGDAVFFQKGDSLCVSPAGNPAHYNQYDISSLALADADPIIIRLNGELLLVCTVFETYVEKTKVAKLDVSLQKNGDLNNDGVINSTDALAVLMSTVDKKTLTEAEKSVADTTKDGTINSTDALMILQYAVGKRLGI